MHAGIKGDDGCLRSLEYFSHDYVTMGHDLSLRMGELSYHREVSNHLLQEGEIWRQM